MKKSIIILGAILAFGLTGCETTVNETDDMKAQTMAPDGKTEMSTDTKTEKTCMPGQADCDGDGRGQTDPTRSIAEECDPEQPDCDGDGRGQTDPT